MLLLKQRLSSALTLWAFSTSKLYLIFEFQTFCFSAGSRKMICEKGNLVVKE